MLNYKSIRPKICAARESQRLFTLEPTFASDPVSRVMLLHPELATLLEEKLTDERIGRLQADLEMLIQGQELALSPVPYQHRTAYMGLLAPEAEGTWEIRSRDPKPGMRVFRRFAEKDWFIALSWGLRSRPDATGPMLLARCSLAQQAAARGSPFPAVSAVPNRGPAAMVRIIPGL